MTRICVALAGFSSLASVCLEIGPAQHETSFQDFDIHSGIETPDLRPGLV